MVHAISADGSVRAERRRFAKPILLLMDGDPETREESALALEADGYHVLTAVNAAQAIVLVVTRAPAVIVADIGTTPTEGWKVCEFVRNHWPSRTRSLLLLLAGSGLPDHPTRLRGLQLGATIRITPDDPHELADIIGKALADPPATL